MFIHEKRFWRVRVPPSTVLKPLRFFFLGVLFFNIFVVYLLNKQGTWNIIY